MSDKIYSRGYELWCFQGCGVSGSIDTLSALVGILGETGCRPVLEPVFKPVRKSIRGELG